jgi:hypothetical protein
LERTVVRNFLNKSGNLSSPQAIIAGMGVFPSTTTVENGAACMDKNGMGGSRVQKSRVEEAGVES